MTTMKEMTCEQLGGACLLVFQAETFEEMAKLSQQHGMEMFEKEDKPHIMAMGKMQEIMQSPEAMKQWMDDKRSDFDQLPEL